MVYPYMLHILNQHDPRSALVHNSFALTVLLCHKLQSKITIDDCDQFMFSHAIKADKKQKLKTKINYA